MIKRVSKKKFPQKHLFFIILLLILIQCGVILLHNFTDVPPCYLPLDFLKMVVAPPRQHRRSCATAYENNRTFEQHYITHSHRTGRLGNLMFETASTLGIAHILKYKTYIEPTHPLNPYFELNSSSPLELENTLLLEEQECKDAVWKCRGEIYSHNLTLNGLLQSFRYFNAISPTIRETFTIRSHFMDLARKFINSVRLDNGSRTVVGVHVRRGDFQHPYKSMCGNTIATTDYIHKAMSLYRNQFKNCYFVVLSDDKGWCKNNIIADDVAFSEFKEPIVDLAIMSLCDHMIMTGGTFGWWGSWLAGGQVVYLKDWPRPGSWLDEYGVVKEDLFPPEWIGLRN